MRLSHINCLTKRSIYAVTLGISLGIASPTFAADRITLNINGKEFVVTIAQLEDYARTGNLSSLSPEIAFAYPSLPLKYQEALNKLPAQLQRPISISPEKIDPDEQVLLNWLIPSSQPEEQQQALALMAEKGNGKTVLSFLDELPVDTLTQENFVPVLIAYVPEKNVPKKATQNILYLNSTRGLGTGNYGSYRDAIASALDKYLDGSIFDVDFVQTQVSGDLASRLNSQPVGHYNQIWFDTTIYLTALLNETDFSALNAWAAYKQPEFILDSSFFARNKISETLTASAAAVTVNQALALRDAGGGILIGTDHNEFAYTANQILSNFGFNGLFTGSYNITANASFNHPILLEPEPVGSDFFVSNLQGLSTSNIPVGTHILNENGGNRKIEIFEVLYSHSPGKVTHIGASFEPKSKSVPEPTSLVGLLGLGALGAGSLLKRKKQ